MLIDDRQPAGDSLLPPWSPNWRVWRWAGAAAVMAVAALTTGGAAATLLIVLAFAAGCRALDEALPYKAGLREWHQ